MEPAERPQVGLGTMLVVGALAVLGAYLVIQIVLGFLFGLVKLAILVVLVAAVVSLLAGRRSR